MRRFRDVCLLGLVLGLSGCAGMQQRLASHPGDPEGSASRTLATRGGRLRHQAAEPPGRTPREPSATKIAAKTARPLTNRPPEAVSRYFPGMNRRGGGAAGVAEPEPARPDPLGVRTSAKQDTGNRPFPEEGRTRSGGEPPSSLPAALNVPVHPDDPSSLYPDALNSVEPGAGRPDALRRPRDEPASTPRTVALPEPVEASKTHAKEPVVPTPGGADESVPVPVPDLPPVHGELPQARVIDRAIDVDNDPILAGRPRLRLAPPSVETRQDGRSERPPDDAFPASYYAVDREARPAVATATVASPTPARPRRTLVTRLLRRSGQPRTGTPTALSARSESRDLAQRRDVVDRVAPSRIDESSKR